MCESAEIGFLSIAILLSSFSETRAPAEPSVDAEFDHKGRQGRQGPALAEVSLESFALFASLAVGQRWLRSRGAKETADGGEAADSAGGIGVSGGAALAGRGAGVLRHARRRGRRDDAGWPPPHGFQARPAGLGPGLAAGRAYAGGLDERPKADAHRG